MKGIDLSVYQKNVNYDILKQQGIDFAIIRCGYGKNISQKDTMFETHYEGLKKAGIKVRYLPLFILHKGRKCYLRS